MNAGDLTIDLKKHDSILILVVSDNGRGFPEDFDIENTETLGLQLVFSLIDQHDGSIEYETHKGTKFTLSFNLR
jgi:two-component sensor histidine kinase